MGTVTVVMPDEDKWFFNELGVGAKDRGAQAGHTVTVCRVPVDAEPGSQAADCIDRAFAAEDSLGAIAAGFPYRGAGSDRFLAWKRPLVIVGGSVLGFPVVSFDDVGIGRTVTTHLLDLGHRRIVHLTGTLAPDRAFIYMRRRARGYRMTMESAGLMPQLVETGLTSEELEHAVEMLLTSPTRPTAVFAVHDEVAFTVMDVAQRLGLQVGRDLSVVGVNDHPDAVGRQLTTARHRPAEVGAMAVEMIVDGLQPGVGSAVSRLQPSTFIPRSSTGRPRAA